MKNMKILSGFDLWRQLKVKGIFPLGNYIVSAVFLDIGLQLIPPILFYTHIYFLDAQGFVQALNLTLSRSSFDRDIKKISSK